MRFSTTLKTLVRSPLKSALTLLLLTATTFAFVSRGVEYVATVQQIRAAEATYFATGTVEMTLKNYEDAMYERLGEEAYTLEGGNYLGRTSRAVLPMGSEVANLILSSEHIEKSETRLVSGGTHNEYSSVFEQPLTDLKDYNEWMDSHEDYGTLGMVSFLAVVENQNCGQMGAESSLRNIYVKDILVGDESIWRRGQEFAFTSGNFAGYDVDEFDIYAANGDFFAQSSEKGHLMLAAGNERLFGAGDTSYTQVVDFPLVDLTRLEAEYGETDIEKILRNPDDYDLTPFKRTDGQEVISVLDYYATVDRNLHTSEVVYTSDMGLIHKFKSGDMFIADGRALAENEQSEVCVIGADFAELNGLSVGDTITLDLCADTMVHSGKVFGRETPYPTDRDVVSENQLTDRGLLNVTKTFEIVGIWSDAAFDVEDPYTYALNTIFVPESCYPWAGQVEPSLLPSTFSFELKHPGDAALIKAELGDQLAALGYELKINDGGYAAAKPNLDFMRLSALIGFVAMCVGLLLCLVLITYLFIIRKKKDYAIMRALGTTKSRSNRSLLSALLTLALVAVTIGAFIAGFAAQTAAAKAAAEVAELTGVEATGVGSWEFTIAFAVGTLGLVFTFARAGLIKISRTPPLALLQGR